MRSVPSTITPNAMLITVVLITIMLASSMMLYAPKPAYAQGSLLDVVKARGVLKCGVNPEVPGFGFRDPATDTYSGFDTDFCRAFAAVILGDATKVEFVPIAAAADRFPKLVSGEIDVLSRNTTFTAGRDTKEGADFAPPTLYDGSSLMVRASDKLTDVTAPKLENFRDATICVINDTTNAVAITEAMAAVNTPFSLVPFDKADEVYAAFAAKRCDAVTSDRSQLAGRRSIAEDSADWVILPLNLTKEPLSPAVKAGDSQFLDVIRWTIYATWIAEEKGIKSKNVEEVAAQSTDPEVRRLLGVDGDLYKAFGLTPQWAVNVIKAVGNYAEIYDRNLGPETPLKIERGLNNLWNNGGLLYPPPFR